MKLSIKLLFITLFTVLSVAAAITAYEFYGQNTDKLGSNSQEMSFNLEDEIFQESEAQCDIFGSKPASQDVQELAQKALKALGVKHQVQIIETARNNCSATYHMWINKNVMQPWQYLIFHEAAHIALGHFKEQFTEEITKARQKEQEQEADLLACKTLYELGMSEFVTGYIDELDKAVREGWGLSNSESHPSFKEMHDYIIDFVEMYKQEHALLEKMGSEPADPYHEQLARKFLAAMDVKKGPFISIYKTEVRSGSLGWHMWLRNQNLGPIEFVVAHEAAHIALCHPETKFKNDSTSDQDSRKYEKDADLKACETLYKLGMSEAIVKRINKLNELIKRYGSEPSTGTHPSYQEMYDYMTAFAQSKGIQYEVNN